MKNPEDVKGLGNIIPFNENVPPEPGYFNGGDDPGYSVYPYLQVVGSASMVPERISWVWDGWLAIGKLQILAGMAGTGKTTLALSIAAQVTRGGVWADGSRCERGNVIVWSGEDDIKDTLLPRLIAMDADLSRVFFMGQFYDAQGAARSFDPSTDMGFLYDAVETCGGARLFIMDPIAGAVAGDSHKNTETRRGLQPVVDFALKANCAVLGITHFTKGTQGANTLERVTGSMAFGAVARVVLSAIKAKEVGTPSRFVRSKSNIGPDGGGYEYKIAQVPVPGYQDLYASCIIWGEALEGTATELASQIENDAKEESEGPSPRQEAREFLERFLADGPHLQKEVMDWGDQEGISKRTLDRAKKEIGVISKQTPKGWVWHLKNWVAM